MRSADNTKNEILECIREFIEMWNQVELMPKSIGLDKNIISDLGLDSVGVLHLILNLEHTYDIHIQDDELSLERISRIKNLVSFVEKKIDENN